MINTIHYKGQDYPAYTASGNAARFILPFAQEVCKGYGYDIGAGRAEWAMPGTIIIDPVFKLGHDAMNLPDTDFGVDYIFSSHCLEHLPDWVAALNYWRTKLKTNGTLFLYLPHPCQEYWLPFNNRKHIHSLTPGIIRAYLNNGGWCNIFVSERDLNYSFAAMATKI